RHFQRFGTDSDALDHFADIRAAAAAFGDTAHADFAMVDQLLKDRGSIDFAALSTDEALALAKKYAASSAMQPADAAALSTAFSAFTEPATWLALLNGDYAVLRALGDAVVTTPSPVAFGVGARALRTILAGEF